MDIQSQVKLVRASAERVRLAGDRGLAGAFPRRFGAL